MCVDTFRALQFVARLAENYATMQTTQPATRQARPFAAMCPQVILPRAEHGPLGRLPGNRGTTQLYRP